MIKGEEAPRNDDENGVERDIHSRRKRKRKRKVTMTIIIR